MCTVLCISAFPWGWLQSPPGVLLHKSFTRPRERETKLGLRDTRFCLEWKNENKINVVEGAQLHGVSQRHGYWTVRAAIEQVLALAFLGL